MNWSSSSWIMERTVTCTTSGSNLYLRPVESVASYHCAFTTKVFALIPGTPFCFDLMPFLRTYGLEHARKRQYGRPPRPLQFGSAAAASNSSLLIFWPNTFSSSRTFCIRCTAPYERWHGPRRQQPVWERFGQPTNSMLREGWARQTVQWQG